MYDVMYDIMYDIILMLSLSWDEFIYVIGRYWDKVIKWYNEKDWMIEFELKRLNQRVWMKKIEWKVMNENTIL
jgi:hypothetical protein